MAAPRTLPITWTFFVFPTYANLRLPSTPHPPSVTTLGEGKGTGNPAVLTESCKVPSTYSACASFRRNVTATCVHVFTDTAVDEDTAPPSRPEPSMRLKNAKESLSIPMEKPTVPWLQSEVPATMYASCTVGSTPTLSHAAMVNSSWYWVGWAGKVRRFPCPTFAQPFHNAAGHAEQGTVFSAHNSPMSYSPRHELVVSEHTRPQPGTVW